MMARVGRQIEMQNKMRRVGYEKRQRAGKREARVVGSREGNRFMVAVKKRKEGGVKKRLRLNQTTTAPFVREGANGQALGVGRG